LLERSQKEKTIVQSRISVTSIRMSSCQWRALDQLTTFCEVR